MTVSSTTNSGSKLPRFHTQETTTMVFNVLGPSAKEPSNCLIAVSLASFHTGSDTKTLGEEMSRIVERFPNAETQCIGGRRLISSFRCVVCFAEGLHGNWLSVTRKGGFVGIRLTGTKDNSRILGQASAIPVRVRVSSPRRC